MCYTYYMAVMRFNDKLNQVNSEGWGGRSSARTMVDACAVDSVSGVFILP